MIFKVLYYYNKNIVNEMKINIKGKEIVLKYSIRSLILFENIMNKTFSIENTQDSIVFFYCVLLASDKTMKITFDEFIDAIDEDPSIVTDFAEWLSTNNKVNKLAEEELAADVKEADGKK